LDTTKTLTSEQVAAQQNYHVISVLRINPKFEKYAASEWQVAVMNNDDPVQFTLYYGETQLQTVNKRTNCELL